MKKNGIKHNALCVCVCVLTPIVAQYTRRFPTHSVRPVPRRSNHRVGTGRVGDAESTCSARRYVCLAPGALHAVDDHGAVAVDVCRVAHAASPAQTLARHLGRGVRPRLVADGAPEAVLVHLNGLHVAGSSVARGSQSNNG